MRLIALVVEDEPLIRITAAEALEDEGFSVLTATNAAEALAILGARAPEIRLLFTDIHMPGPLDGLTLAHKVRHHYPWIALLIASGRAQPRPQELPEGSEFLPKPYDPSRLIQRTRRLASA